MDVYWKFSIINTCNDPVLIIQSSVWLTSYILCLRSLIKEDKSADSANYNILRGKFRDSENPTSYYKVKAQYGIAHYKFRVHFSFCFFCIQIGSLNSPINLQDFFTKFSNRRVLWAQYTHRCHLRERSRNWMMSSYARLKIARNSCELMENVC